MMDAEQLVGYLMELEDKYYDLQSKYQTLIHQYEELKEKYENRSGYRDESGSLYDPFVRHKAP